MSQARTTPVILRSIRQRRWFTFAAGGGDLLIEALHDTLSDGSEVWVEDETISQSGVYFVEATDLIVRLTPRAGASISIREQQ